MSSNEQDLVRRIIYRLQQRLARCGNGEESMSLFFAIQRLKRLVRRP